MQKRFAILSAVALLTGSAAAVQAQAGLGVIGGVSQSTFTGGGSQEVTWQKTFLVGVVGFVPLGENLSVRPEVHFATKGARPRVGRTASAALDLAYLELPLLLEVLPPSGGLLRPRLYGGMSVGMLLGCKREQVDCDDDRDFVGHDFDTGLVVGGELEAFGAGIGMRYEAGLNRVKADLEGLEIVNGVLSFTLRYMFQR